MENKQYKDIIGLNVKRPDEGEVQQMFDRRRNLMKSARTDFENDWDVTDAQVDAPVSYDNNGKLNINAPTSQNLIEIHTGRQAGQMFFNIEPDGNKADVTELQPAKYILEYYIEQGDFWKERRQFELDKATYGTGIFFSGISQTIEEMYEYTDGTEINNSDDLYDPTKIKKYDSVKRTFTPKNIPIRNFRVDERSIFQPYFSNARDCIYQEELSVEEVVLRRGKNKFFMNIDKVSSGANLDPAYGRTNNAVDKVVIQYYFNKITKDYWIRAGYNLMIFIGKQLYKHGKLPFSMAQHFPKNCYLYGRGIPRKIRYIQAYKSQMMQNANDKIQMSSGINIGIGNNGEVASDLYTSAGEINIWRFTESLQNVQQYQLDGNITGIINLLNIIDDFIIQDTGDNIKAPYSSPAGTLGEVEIMEENKQIRQKSIDEARDICLDESLTMSLSTIQQFAPKLQMKTTKDEEGNIIKVEYPVITIPNTRIEKDGKDKIYVKDMGEYGYFEFRPDTINSPLRVKIVTATTRSPLQALAKNSFTQFIQNLMTTAKVYPEMLQMYSKEKISELMNLTYGYDTVMVAETKKDKIKKANLEKEDEIKEMLGLPVGGLENSLSTMGGNVQTPKIPMGDMGEQETKGGEAMAGGDMGAMENIGL